MRTKDPRERHELPFCSSSAKLKIFHTQLGSVPLVLPFIRATDHSPSEGIRTASALVRGRQSSYIWDWMCLLRWLSPSSFGRERNARPCTSLDIPVVIWWGLTVHDFIGTRTDAIPLEPGSDWIAACVGTPSTAVLWECFLPMGACGNCVYTHRETKTDVIAPRMSTSTGLARKEYVSESRTPMTKAGSLSREQGARSRETAGPTNTPRISWPDETPRSRYLGRVVHAQIGPHVVNLPMKPESAARIKRAI